MPHSLLFWLKPVQPGFSVPSNQKSGETECVADILGATSLNPICPLCMKERLAHMRARSSSCGSHGDGPVGQEEAAEWSHWYTDAGWYTDVGCQYMDVGWYTDVGHQYTDAGCWCMVTEDAGVLIPLTSPNAHSRASRITRHHQTNFSPIIYRP